MKKSTKEANSGKAEMKSVFDELIQQGVRQMIQQTVEAELAAMLEQYSNVKSIEGRRVVVRNGYLPECEIVMAVGSVKVKVPKGRDRSGSGIHFNPAGCATIRAQVGARVGGAAVDVPARHLDG